MATTKTHRFFKINSTSGGFWWLEYEGTGGIFGKLDVSGSLRSGTHSTDTITSDDITCNSGAVFQKLDVSGTLTATTFITSTLTIDDLTCSSGAVFQKLDVSGALSAGSFNTDSLTVDNITCNSGGIFQKLDVSGALTAATFSTSSLSVDDLTCSSGAIFEKLDVSGSSTVGSTLIIGALDVSGDFVTQGDGTVQGTLSVTGATGLSSTLNVTSAISAQGMLEVYNTMDVSGAVTFNNNMNVYGNITHAQFATNNIGSGYGATTRTINTSITNGEYVTTILLDIAGIEHPGTTDMVMCDSGAAAGTGYILKVDSSLHGFIYKVEISCIETPYISGGAGEAGIVFGGNTDLYTYQGLVVASGTFVRLLGSAATGGGGSGLWVEGNTYSSVIPEDQWGGGYAEDATPKTLTDGLHDYYIYTIPTSNTPNAGATYTAGQFVIKLYGANF